MTDSGRGILVGVESAHIQSYIFGSNRLRENVGASYVVAQATDQWVKEAVPKEGAAVLYAGGGNSVIWFRTSELARVFTRELSGRALMEAPGLQITINHCNLDDTKETLSTVVSKLLKSLKPARSAIPRYGALAGLGVTAACESTGLPAVAYKEVARNESRYVSAEVKEKLDKFQDADKMLEKVLGLGLGERDYTYPYDLDELGREEGEASFIAVAHADGNGMGRRVSGIGAVFDITEDEVGYVDTLRAFSDGIKTMTQNAMWRLLDLLKRNVYFDDKLKKYVIGVEERQSRIILEYDPRREKKIVLPFRPLVTGGDDVTFICDGRIGLSLAVAFLRFFEEESQSVIADLRRRLEEQYNTAIQRNILSPDDQEKLVEIANEVLEPITACAGVAIVKTHYPFSRAYELAEGLCDKAKKFKRDNNIKGSALDWHFTPGGLYGDIEDDIREREYRIRTQEEDSTPIVWNFTLRPVSLEGEHPLRNWPLIDRVLSEFQYKWSGKRNKAKALRDSLRGGQPSVSLFANRYEQALPVVDGFVDGWHLSEKTGERDEETNELKLVHHYCCYEDALELMDLYIPLEAAP